MGWRLTVKRKITAGTRHRRKKTGKKRGGSGPDIANPVVASNAGPIGAPVENLAQVATTASTNTTITQSAANIANPNAASNAAPTGSATIASVVASPNVLAHAAAAAVGTAANLALVAPVENPNIHPLPKDTVVLYKGKQYSVESSNNNKRIYHLKDSDAKEDDPISASFNNVTINTSPAIGSIASTIASEEDPIPQAIATAAASGVAPIASAEATNVVPVDNTIVAEPTTDITVPDSLVVPVSHPITILPPSTIIPLHTSTSIISSTTYDSKTKRTIVIFENGAQITADQDEQHPQQYRCTFLSQT